MTALGAVAFAVLCRHIGLDWTESLAFGFIGWAAFPASAMALQVYPETCAALAILVALALLTRPTQTSRSLILAGALAGFPWFLHVRFVVVATVLALFGAWTLRRAVPRLILFALGWSIPVVAQLWFVYHATGIPWPTAFYRTAAQSVVRASVVPPNMLRFVADRDWGFLPHAPILLLLGAGFVALWRVRRDLALAVAGVAVALTATAATHNVAAGGGTPGRLITGMMPLLFLPVAALTSSWKTHRGLRWVSFILALVTLDQAWDYNRAHVKEVGVFVSPGASGWRINLMFPYLSDGFAAHAGRALIAVAIPAVLALALALRRLRRSAAAAWQSVAAFIGVVIVCLSVAGAWRLWQPRYRMTEAQARAAVVAAYVRAGSCASCWSSLGGPMRPQELAANTLESISLTATHDDDRRVSFALAATGPDGPVFGTVRLDFGDGQVSAPEVMGGSLDIQHQYREPGEYKVRAWVAPPGAPQRLGTATVRVGGASR